MKGWTPRVDLAVNTTQNTTTITTRCCFFFCSGPSLSALSTCHVVCLPGRNSVELDVIVSLLIIPPVFAFLHLPATRPSPPATSYLYYDPSRPGIYFPSSFVSAFFFFHSLPSFEPGHIHLHISLSPFPVLLCYPGALICIASCFGVSLSSWVLLPWSWVAGCTQCIGGFSSAHI